MALRWRADDGATLNADLVALRISGDPLLFVCDFSGGGEGPTLDPRMGPANGQLFTENPIDFCPFY